jgi:hypothetical protein
VEEGGTQVITYSNQCGSLKEQWIHSTLNQFNTVAKRVQGLCSGRKDVCDVIKSGKIHERVMAVSRHCWRHSSSAPDKVQHPNQSKQMNKQQGERNIVIAFQTVDDQKSSKRNVTKDFGARTSQYFADPSGGLLRKMRGLR